MRLSVPLISEVSYPTGKGGVSWWCHSLINGMKDARSNLFSMSSETRMRYKLLSNIDEAVVEHLYSPNFKHGIDERCAGGLIKELRPVLLGEPLDCEEILKLTKRCECGADELLGSDINWNSAVAYYKENFPGRVFAHFYIFWISLFYLLHKTLEAVSKILGSDVYHTLNAGYAGLLGCLFRMIQEYKELYKAMI
jgi:hypothetical protein